MDEQSTFDYLYANRNDAEMGQKKINVALNHIEEHNSGKLRNVFRAIDFQLSGQTFGGPKEEELRPAQLAGGVSTVWICVAVGWVPADIIGDAYEVHDLLCSPLMPEKGWRVLYPKAGSLNWWPLSWCSPRESDRIRDPT
ncbi:MAG: hypothetical protein ACLTSG_06380 [Lachnospiraceae bacterium]